MRIAVLFYGRINKYKEHHANILDSIGREHTLDIFLSCDFEPQESIEEFVNLYTPISYTNDKIYDVNFLDRFPGVPVGTNIQNMVRHFTNKKRVFKLLEEHIEKEHIQYDCVLSLRLDLVFHNAFDFNVINENTLYIPYWRTPFEDPSLMDYGDPGINDQVAHGPLVAMKKYMNIIDTVVYLLEQNKSIPHPESLNYANLAFHSISTFRTKLTYHHDK